MQHTLTAALARSDPWLLSEGSTLFHSGTPADALYFISKGGLELHSGAASSADDDEAQRLLAPAVVATVPFLRAGVHDRTARARVHSQPPAAAAAAAGSGSAALPRVGCVVWVLKREAWEQLLADFPADRQQLGIRLDGGQHPADDAAAQEEARQRWQAEVVRHVCDADEAGLRALLAGDARSAAGVAGPEWRDEDGRTVLHHACSLGHAAIVDVLCEHGADIWAKDDLAEGATPIDVALSSLSVASPSHEAAVLAVLRRHGARPTVLYPAASLCAAARAGDVAALDRLLGLPGGACPVSARDEQHRTALHVAAASGQLAAAEVLLRHGADAQLTDGRGATALDDAIEAGHGSLVQEILAALPPAAAAACAARHNGCARAAAGDLAGLRLLQRVGVKMNRTDADGAASVASF
jgi:hypothetical protein